MTKRPKKAPARKRPAATRPAENTTTKALARLERKLAKHWPGESLAPAMTVEPAAALSEDPMLGNFGLVEVKLTPEEEKVLARPVDPARVLMKPTGQPYLSHPEYTRWFNDAFGRLGWSMVPVAKPKYDGRAVVVPYVMHIHGKPAAFAWGEQEYHEKNREQTYGDAIEATVASALRRCAKRLGVSLELWDKLWIDAFIHEHCIRVPVRKRGKDGKYYTGSAWRTKDGPPFPEEIDPKAKRTDEGEAVEDELLEQRPEPTQRRESSRGYSSRRDADPISDAQVRRLWVILRNSGRNEEVVRTWLATRFKVDSTTAIARGDYDFICKAIESSGPLPLAGGKS